MNPVVIGRGASFKGLAQYILHDQKAASAERVGFVETHNLDDVDPDRAWRLMAGTAKNANAIKEAAGLRTSGGQNKKPVYHFALTWPDEDRAKLSPDLQRQAVKESLAALGMSQLQAMAVQHLDGKPHVHVMVNMISPEDGTTAKLSNDHKKLSSWAKKFEMKHGLTVVEGRAENEAKRKAGEQVEARRKSRNVYEQEQREGQDRRTAWLRRQERGLAENLTRTGREMKHRHDAAWTAAKETFQARKSAIYDQREAEITAAIEDVKSRYKSQWRDEYAAGRKRLRDFDKAEKSALTRIVNGVTAFWNSKESGEDVATSLSVGFNSEKRRAMVTKTNKAKTDELAAQQREEKQKIIAEIKRRYGVELDANRIDYLGTCDKMKAEKSAERAQHRQEWRDYNDRRKANHVRFAGGQQQSRGRGRDFGLHRGFDPGQD